MNAYRTRIEDVMVAGPAHPSFPLDRAWCIFGMYAPDGSVRRFFLVEAQNKFAIQLIEALVQQDGSVSSTCGLISVSAQPPQIRSTTMEQVSYVDFIIDIVDDSKWMNSPLLIVLFQRSLSAVDRISANLKVESAIRRREWEDEQKDENEDTSESEAVSNVGQSVQDRQKLEQLTSGLTGLGFQKRDVQSFVTSVQNRSESVQDLLMEGIKKLSRGLS